MIIILDILINMKFDLNDILLVPAITSNVLSRKEEVNTRYNDGYLPLLNAPMDRVINRNNEELFDFNGINTVQVRGVDPVLEHTIKSMSLNEIIEAFETDTLKSNGRYLIDMANGHISIIPLIVQEIKTKFPNLYLMVGNIAHPETYKLLAESGADAVRLSIGTGGSCFIKGSKVKTNNGYVNIENIKIGDHVLTHRGNYCEVYNVIKEKVTEPLIKINQNISTKKMKRQTVI